MRNADTRTVRSRQETFNIRHDLANIRHDLATFNIRHDLATFHSKCLWSETLIVGSRFLS